MSWDVILLPRALDDYMDALDYLSGFYPTTPLKFDDELLRVKSRLAYNPRSCSVYPDFPAYRRALVGKYTLLYKIDEERHEVHIHRIIRSSWDIPSQLQNSEDTEDDGP